ncbi:YceI family protein [Pelagibius sp. Alg239-R121]|uniref:c-type cytochrome n=1 Tax=Pelagibius sp. Alg239-R121 TaxID=2993448 RepID=UPI0024A6F0D4|nr:YceI family protein [Pelagibius sp. Alg239-R121]
MMKVFTSAAFALAVLTGTAQAESWSLSSEESKVSFGSIKKGSVGEVHHFGSVTGQVAADGAVKVEIDVASVETWIDIRNERMLKWVFDAVSFPKAVISAQIDMSELEALKPGETTSMDVTANLSVAGQNGELEASLFVARLSDGKVLVTSDEMLMLSTADFGLAEGVEKLREIAKLDSIAQAAPVSLRLVFTADEKSAAVTPAQPSSLLVPVGLRVVPAGLAASEVAAVPMGDAKAGKKAFRRCKACHEVTAEKNKVGPHLVGVVGRTAGTVDGYKYSEAMSSTAIVWTPEALGEFLKGPKDYVPGTKMTAKLKKQKDIDDIIAYLAESTK